MDDVLLLVDDGARGFFLEPNLDCFLLSQRWIMTLTSGKEDALNCCSCAGVSIDGAAPPLLPTSCQSRPVGGDERLLKTIRCGVDWESDRVGDGVRWEDVWGPVDCLAAVSQGCG